MPSTLPDLTLTYIVTEVVSLIYSKPQEKIARFCPLTVLRHDKSISKNEVRNLVNRDFKNDHVRDAIQKILGEAPGTNPYEMGFLRWYHFYYVLLNGSFDMNYSYHQTQYRSVHGTDQTGEGYEHDDEDNAEAKHKPFKNMSPKTVLADYCALMEGERRDGGECNGNNNDGEHICRKETNGNRKDLDCTMLFIALLDAYIINFLLCVVSDKFFCGRRQKIYVDKF